MSMTWKDFKKAAEVAGVKDEDEVYYIDVGDYLKAITFDRAEEAPDAWKIWS